MESDFKCPYRDCDETIPKVKRYVPTIRDGETMYVEMLLVDKDALRAHLVNKHTRVGVGRG